MATTSDWKPGEPVLLHLKVLCSVVYEPKGENLLEEIDDFTGSIAPDNFPWDFTSELIGNGNAWVDLVAVADPKTCEDIITGDVLYDTNEVLEDAHDRHGYPRESTVHYVEQLARVSGKTHKETYVNQFCGGDEKLLDYREEWFDSEGNFLSSAVWPGHGDG